MSKSDYEIVYPDPTPAGVTLEKNVKASMRDGVKIAADVYRPSQGEGPWPAILAYSPFQNCRTFCPYKLWFGRGTEGCLVTFWAQSMIALSHRDILSKEKIDQ